MQENSALGRSMAMVRDLRLRCAWDRVQTRDTLRPYLIEEVHELDHAIGSGDPAAIRSEVAGGILGRELQPFLSQHELPGEVEQQVGYLAPDRRRISRADRLVQLVDLFDQVRPERVAGLNPIPGAPHPEVPDHRHRASKR